MVGHFLLILGLPSVPRNECGLNKKRRLKNGIQQGAVKILPIAPASQNQHHQQKNDDYFLREQKIGFRLHSQLVPERRQRNPDERQVASKARRLGKYYGIAQLQVINGNAGSNSKVGSALANKHEYIKGTNFGNSD